MVPPGGSDGSLTSRPPGPGVAIAEPEPQRFGTEKIRHRRYAPSVRDGAGFWSRAFFGWIGPLVALGHERTLREVDLPELPADQRAQHVSAQARLAWREELQREDAATPPSLYRAGYRLVRAELAWSGLAELVKVSCSFAGPIITRVLVQYLSETERGRPRDATPWLCALAMLLMPLAAGLAKVHQVNLLTNVGVRLKTAMTTLVFDKAVRLSAEGRSVCSRGETLNIVAQDAEKVAMAAPKFHLVWSAPLTTVVCLVLLAREIGFGAAMAGFSMLWVGFVALGAVFAGLSSLTKKRMVQSDARVGKMSEFLRGIRILKLYCWEEPMAQSIDAIRKREVAVLRKTIWLQAGIQIVLLSIPSLMALVSFKVFVWANQNLGGEKWVLKVRDWPSQNGVFGSLGKG